ncbi:MAG: plasmid pRiA4b ORF-3 family protein, partial [Bacteroidales bacterium]|nr:plasmid pRiA4b ORF-3 family protein [Bacteroidales bacterium]
METYQILISLKDSEPKIWRRILISSGLPLSDFHKVIQSTMGWTNSHLHQFVKNRTFYTVRMQDDDSWNEMNNVDYTDMKVSDLLLNENDTIIYEYDFGDGWMHDIILEKKITNDP